MSDAMFSIIMYAIMLPVLIVMAAMYANETEPKKNIILGVTLPYAARTDGEVKALCADFKKRMWLRVPILALIGLPSFFTPFSVAFTIQMIWIVAIIVVTTAVYVKAHLKLKALKKARGWFRRREAPVTVVDITSMSRPRRALSPWCFALPLAVSLIPVVLSLTVYRDETLWVWVGVCLAFAGLSALSWALYPIIFRLRTDVAGSDSGINAALTNVRRANWGRAWIYISWSTALCGLCSWLARNSELWQLVIICVYTFALLRLCVWTELGTRRAQAELTDKYDSGSYVDEDEYWLWGMFYNNPNDRHLTVNARVGMNMSFNLARPAGKVIMGLSALIIAAMPFFGVWMMGVEFSPRRVELSGESLTVVHLTKQFTLDCSELERAELIEELPRSYRTNGIGMETLLEGHFTVEGYGKCRLCLDPGEGPYIVLSDGERSYIFSAELPGETRDIYQQIVEGSGDNA